MEYNFRFQHDHQKKLENVKLQQSRELGAGIFLKSLTENLQYLLAVKELSPTWTRKKETNLQWYSRVFKSDPEKY